jgi:hypothetical protein
MRLMARPVESVSSSGGEFVAEHLVQEIAMRWIEQEGIEAHNAANRISPTERLTQPRAELDADEPLQGR